MNRQLRAIVGARVSVLTGPQKVSHQAQIETATKWAVANDCTIVGSFEDLGVSASVPPHERPDLGQWLTAEGADGWDVVVWSKMDRAFRSTRHCVDFAQWAEEHNKVVVFAEDGLRLDYRPGAAKGIDAMMAELFVYLGSFFAQLELNRFKTRAQDAQRVLRGTDRIAKGIPPLGFQTVDHPSGKGKGLATDPVGKQLLYEMAGLLLDGWSFTRIAEHMNAQGRQTNMDRARIANGKPPRVNPWTTTNVIAALTSAKTQGFKTVGESTGTKTVLDDQGNPIRMAPPTFDDDTWAQIQRVVAERKANPRTRTHTTNPMLGVGYCRCGASLAQKHTPYKDVVYRYYQCGRSPVSCRNTSIRAELLDDQLEDTFIAHYGDKPVTRRVFVPGADHSYELEQTKAIIDRLRKESDMGLIVGDEDERLYLERMRSLVDRRKVLEAEPYRPAGWVVETTGETYADAWKTHNHQELLIQGGVKLTLVTSNPLNISLYVPEDGDTL